MLFFLTEGLRLPTALAGLALLLPRIWDAAIDPFVGAISDRVKCKMGRRRPFLLVGGLTYGIAFALIFMVPHDLGTTAKFAWVVALYMITSTAFTFYDVPYSSMAAEMSETYEGRTVLTGYKMIAARLGILLTILAAPALFSGSGNLALGFQQMGLWFGAFMVVTGLFAFFATKHAPQIVRPVERFSLYSEFRALAENRPFLILWSVFLLQNLAIGATATTLIYFAVFVMHMKPAMVGTLAAMGALSATLATPVWTRIARRLGKRKTYFISLTSAALLSLPALFIAPDTQWLLFAVLFTAGIADGANQLMPNAMVPDTVEFDEHNTGQRREGTIFGTWAFCRKLGMALGAFAVSLLLARFGFVEGGKPDMQPQVAIDGIRIAYSLLPCLLWIGAILTLRHYHLDEVRFNTIKAAIDARRNNNA
ncbi:MAG: MFS transporter [Pseudomonadota bacterium]